MNNKYKFNVNISCFIFLYNMVFKYFKISDFKFSQNESTRPRMRYLVSLHAVLLTPSADALTDLVPPVWGAGWERLEGLLQQFLFLGGPGGRVLNCIMLSHLF